MGHNKRKLYLCYVDERNRAVVLPHASESLRSKCISNQPLKPPEHQRGPSASLKLKHSNGGASRVLRVRATLLL